MKPKRPKPFVPPTGLLKVWSVEKDHGSPLWTTSPEHAIVYAGLDIVSAHGVPKMNPHESMESLWPHWAVKCYRVDPDWYAALPESSKLVAG